jgi:hypothetical protein
MPRPRPIPGTALAVIVISLVLYLPCTFFNAVNFFGPSTSAEDLGLGPLTGRDDREREQLRILRRIGTIEKVSSVCKMVVAMAIVINALGLLLRQSWAYWGFQIVVGVMTVLIVAEALLALLWFIPQTAKLLAQARPQPNNPINVNLVQTFKFGAYLSMIFNLIVNIGFPALSIFLLSNKRVKKFYTRSSVTRQYDDDDGQGSDRDVEARTRRVRKRTRYESEEL